MGLTQEQVMTKLQVVPVFMLLNPEGEILLATPTEGEDQIPVAGVFTEGESAQNFLDSLKQSEPQAVETVRVVPVSLAKIYQLSQERRDQVQFAFVPVTEQVQVAQAIVQQEDPANAPFQGVPLFAARSGESNAYLTIQQGDRQVVMMFLDYQELKMVLERLQQDQPDLAAQMSIQVITLEGLIATLRSSSNGNLEHIELKPSTASLEFVESFQQANPGFG